METFETPSLTDRIALTLDGLARAVAARSARGSIGWVLAGPLILLIWRRVKRADVEIRALLARFRAGRLGRPRAARAKAARGRREGASQGGWDGLPRRFGWLIPLVPYEAACFGSQLRVSLGDPEMVALLAASPRARRVLAPLCRMLAIETAVLGPVGRAAEFSAEAVAEVSPARIGTAGGRDRPAVASQSAGPPRGRHRPVAMRGVVPGPSPPD